jgi:hypothetical protein
MDEVGAQVVVLHVTDEAGFDGSAVLDFEQVSAGFEVTGDGLLVDDDVDGVLLVTVDDGGEEAIAAKAAGITAAGSLTGLGLDAGGFVGHGVYSPAYVACVFEWLSGVYVESAFAAGA